MLTRYRFESGHPHSAIMPIIQKGGKHLKVTIKALRVNAGISQGEAATQLGVTQRTLQNWETHATSPTAAQLVNICKVYGCGLGDIFLPDALAKSEGKSEKSEQGES